MTHIFRVVVRGMFADLSDEARQRLSAEADQHDIFLSSYTADGTFTYEPRLDAFSFRYEVREVSESSASDSSASESGASDSSASNGSAPADVEARVLARAEAAAVQYLASNGIGFKRLRSTATNMADMWRD